MSDFLENVQTPKLKSLKSPDFLQLSVVELWLASDARSGSSSCLAAAFWL
jgi:hypothetical protein